MKEIFILSHLKIDETNRNAPSIEDCQTAVWNALSTPDNSEFGILELEVNTLDVKNSKYLVQINKPLT